MHPALRHFYYSSSRGGYSDFINASLNTYSDKVYYQHRSGSADNYIRIWSPINAKYAQYWDIKDHDSTSEDYINFGRGGVCEYFELTNPDSHTGTLAGEGTSTSYISTLNGTVTISFFGSKIYFKHFSDNRGGIMRFVLDGGADTIDVSTYAASGSRSIDELFADLDPTVEHTVVGTFIGDDPENAPSGGTSRGWIATDSSTSGTQCHEKAFWVVGSPTPNSAYPNTQEAGQVYEGLEFVGFSNKDFAFSMRKSGSAVGYTHVPLHTSTGSGTTFTTLATDRTLKADGGSNILDTLTVVDFATECDSIVLSQIFQGHNSNETAEELIDVTLTITFTNNGPKVNGSIEALQDIDADILYLAMFPNLTAKFDTLLYKAGESDTTITDGTNEVLYTTETIGDWDGNAVYVNKEGTAEELEYSLAFKMVAPSTALKVGTAYGQYLFLDHRDTTLQKMYPVIADGVTIPTGTIWTWEAYFSCQMISGGAYNKYR